MKLVDVISAKQAKAKAEAQAATAAKSELRLGEHSERAGAEELA